MPRKKTDRKSLQSHVQDLAKEVGIELKWDADADLRKMRCGNPITLAQLKALPDGSPIWVTWREHGESGFRIRQAMRAFKDEKSEDTWILSDGSSFGAEFSAECKLEDRCFDSCGGVGEMYLYEVLPMAPKSKKPA